MADKGSARRPAGQDLEASSPDRIRNVVLVGPGGSGKTTLVETLLAAAGAIPRAGSVRDGTTVCDFEESEQAHERSISLAVAPLVHEGIKVNLIDTPGYADFVGELRAGLRAADCALFVIAANEGVDDATRSLWRECADVGMPRAVIITKLDQARADYDGVLAQAQDAFGDKVMPLYLPVREGSEVVSLDRAARAQRPRAARRQLIEGVIEESEDETLMDRYLGGEEIDEKVLIADLERAVARATFFPVVPVCSVTGVGCAELLDLATPRLPVPVRASLRPRCSPPPAPRASRSPATPRARSWPRSSRRPATRTSAGSAWSGSSPARCGPTSRCTSRGTSPPSSARDPATRTTTRTSGSAASPTRSASTRSRPTRSSPATSAPSAGSPGPRPATPSRRSTTRGC